MDNRNMLNNFQFSISNFQSKKFEKILLENRGFKTKKSQEEFLKPNLKSVTTKSLGISNIALAKTLERVKEATLNKEQIIIYGDYDVDGVCATAILWETLRDLGANVMPYIPHRVKHGYGLSKIGIEDMLVSFPKTKLLFTVDNGIVAFEGALFAKEKGIDVVITDHHLPSDKLPGVFAVIHSTLVCGTGVAYVLAKEFKKKFKNVGSDNHLELVALATVADLMPLVGPNRALLKEGLIALQKTRRVGLIESFKEADIDSSKIGTYEIGHIIAPRLNAMGRMEYAMDSLRLICTTSKPRAAELAKKLGLTNKDRQKLTFDTVIHAKELAKGLKKKKIIIISHETYEEGVIGLVAGRIAEEFYRPSIVISKGKIISKASARSVKGFNIIEFIREAQEYLINAGGHPGAAGFSFETKNLEKLIKKLEELAEKVVDEKLLIRKVRVDMELPLNFVNEKTYKIIEELEPFGMANPQPTFLAKNVKIESSKIVGVDGKHLKLVVAFSEKPQDIVSAIAFGMGDNKLKQGDKIDIVYVIEENVWNDRVSYELKLKDICVSEKN